MYFNKKYDMNKCVKQEKLLLHRNILKLEISAQYAGFC